MLYFMRVDDVMESFSDHWFDRRFRAKKPTYAGGLARSVGRTQPHKTARGTMAHTSSPIDRINASPLLLVTTPSRSL